MADQQKQAMQINTPLWRAFMAQYQKRQQRKREPSNPLSAFLPFLGLSQYQGDWVSGGTRVTIDAAELSEYETAPPWFVYDGAEMVFSGERTALSNTYNFRSELRHGNEWNPAGVNVMSMSVTLPVMTTLNEYTFGQIHRKESFATQPPARLVWIASRSSVLNNIYVVARRDNGTYQYFALGTKPEGEFNVSLELDALTLTVRINGEVKYTGLQSDWAGYNCYYKAGVYLTGSAVAVGSAAVRVSAVSVSNSIINQVAFG